jgi:hypothetical protein
VNLFASCKTRRSKKLTLILRPSSSVGCKLVATDSWHTDCPLTTTVIGLKELEESEEPLPQTHIQFAHCYKHQAGWSSVLKRFRQGGGTLYDLEFLQDANGRRVAAFGFHAGFAGAAAGCLAVGAQQGGGRLGGLKPYKNEGEMVEVVKKELQKLGRPVKALVIGALGRCGSGAVDLFRKVGLTECVVSLPRPVAGGCRLLTAGPERFTSLEKTSSSGTWPRRPRADLSLSSLMVRAFSVGSLHAGRC